MKYSFFILSVISLLFLTSNTVTASNFYLKGITGSNFLNKAQEKNEKINFKITQDSLVSSSFGIGGGCYLNDTHRIEVIFDYITANFDKEASNFEYYDSANDILTIGNNSVKRKSSIKSVMINHYVNILDKDTFKIFIGAGVGVAQIKEKVSFSMKSNLMMQGQMFPFPTDTIHLTSKKRNNFTHALITGISLQVRPNINLDISYNWRDLGKTKHKMNEEGESATSNRYKGHFLLLGIRVDI